MAASTRSRTLRAILRSVLIQNSRSRRNSMSNTASRLAASFKPHLPPQFLDRLRFAFALFRATERRQEPLRIGRRAEQVRGFQEAAQLVSGNEGHVLGSAA